MGKYIYCVTDLKSQKTYGPIGLGEVPQEVTQIIYQDLAAIVSESPVTKYELSRRNLISHQKVCEEVMKDSPILPVKFATVAESDEQILTQVLEARYKELSGLLLNFSDKIELGLKVLWNDMELVFKNLLAENSLLQKQKEFLAKENPEKTYYERAEFGRRVKETLEQKKEKISKTTLSEIEKLAVETKKLTSHGDRMILNQAFLVKKEDQSNFDTKIWALTERFGDLQFKYVGPLPPFNFIQLVINLEKGK